MKAVILAGGDGKRLRPYTEKRLYSTLTDDALCSMAITHPRLPFGLVRTEKYSNVVLGFDEKPIIHEMYINAGVYLFRNEVLDMLEPVGDLERNILPKLADMRAIRSHYFMHHLWMSIDNVKDLEEAEKRIKWIYHHEEDDGSVDS